MCYAHAHSPTAMSPHTEQDPCTGITPTGSSTRRRHNRLSVPVATRAPTMPMIMASHVSHDVHIAENMSSAICIHTPNQNRYALGKCAPLMRFSLRCNPQLSRQTPWLTRDGDERSQHAINDGPDVVLGARAAMAEHVAATREHNKHAMY